MGGQNGVVVATLMNIGKMDNSIVFVMCVLMLAFATLCQHNLIQMTTGSKTSQAEALKEINEIGEDNNELEASSDNNVVNTGNNETNASSSTATDIEAPDAAVAAVDAKTADSKGD